MFSLRLSSWRKVSTPVLKTMSHMSSVWFYNLLAEWCKNVVALAQANRTFLGRFARRHITIDTFAQGFSQFLRLCPFVPYSSYCLSWVKIFLFCDFWIAWETRTFQKLLSNSLWMTFKYKILIIRSSLFIEVVTLMCWVLFCDVIVTLILSCVFCTNFEINGPMYRHGVKCSCGVKTAQNSANRNYKWHLFSIVLRIPQKPSISTVLDTHSYMFLTLKTYLKWLTIFTGLIFIWLQCILCIPLKDVQFHPQK